MNFFKNIKILVFLFLLFTIKISYAIDLKSKAKEEANAKINDISRNIADTIGDMVAQNENIKYFDIAIQLQENLKPSITIHSVNKLVEDFDSAIFNQTNLTVHDGDKTINIGFGKRKLVNNELLMLGSNIFFDYQIDEDHMRNGIGLEAISSVLDLRGNYYNAISGYKKVSGGKEKALTGYDLQFDYHFPQFSSKYLYNANLFGNYFEWQNPSTDYEEVGNKIGANAKIGNLQFEGGYINSNKSSNDGYFGNVKLIIPIGERIKQAKNNNKNNKYVSVRDKLYIPVKRENKIRVVKISSGVKVSGF